MSLSDEEFKDRVIALLEIIAFGPSESGDCPHENAVDKSVMGQQPGTRMQCKDCGAEFSRMGDKS